jgi:hypothetical protein
VDVNVLAELSAGLISGRRATRIHAHLAGCQRCARVSAGLSEVSVLLSSVPPPAMPEPISRRLTTAIAEEAATRSGAGVSPVRLAGQQASQRTDRVHRGPPAARRRALTSPVGARVFAAAAAVCVVAAGGYTLVRLTAPGGSGPVLNAGARGTMHRHAATAPGPYQVGPAHSGEAVPGPTQPTFDVVSSGIDYQQANLGAQIASEMSKVSAISADSAAGRRMLHGPSAQQDGCVQRVTSSVKPALVDAARYQGHPATVIALAHKGNQVAQAWVVGPHCSARVSDVLTHVSLPSPGG